MDTQYFEVDVHLLANFYRLFECQLIDLYGFLLVANSSPDEVSFGQDCITNLDIAEVLFSVSDLIVEFLDLFRVVLLLLNLHLKYF